MASIVTNAELCVDYDAQYAFTRDHNAGSKRVSMEEATLSNVAKTAIDIADDKYSLSFDVLDVSAGELIVVFTSSGLAANIVSKYRPPCPIIVVSDSDTTLRGTNSWFGQFPFKARAHMRT